MQQISIFCISNLIIVDWWTWSASKYFSKDLHFSEVGHLLINISLYISSKAQNQLFYLLLAPIAMCARRTGLERRPKQQGAAI